MNEPLPVPQPPAAGETRLARIALGLLVEPGHRELGLLTRAAGPVIALARVINGQAGPRLRDLAATRLGGRDPYQMAEAAIERSDRLGARLITPDDEEWPDRLEDLTLISRAGARPIDRDTMPPHCLWIRGDWPLAEALNRSVAVVGARASTSYGNHVATDLGYGLASRGWTVVSGGAFGIDAAAHRGALAADGVTIAVLANGVDRPYPLSHASLFEQIAGTGLVVSEWPPEADPYRHRFLVRNRVIAAATRGTVMVEANARSGARFTLHRARDLGRAQLVVPGPVTSAMSVGCHEELREPDVTLVTNAGHVIEAVGRMGEELVAEPRGLEEPHDRLTDVQLQVLDGVLPRKARTAEEIAQVVGVAAREARQILPALCALNFVVPVDGGYRLRRPSDDD
jgi:DNA processing protein